MFQPTRPAGRRYSVVLLLCKIVNAILVSTYLSVGTDFLLQKVHVLVASLYTYLPNIGRRIYLGCHSLDACFRGITRLLICETILLSLYLHLAVAISVHLRMAARHHHHHPLQRLSSPSRQFSLLFHIVGIASFASSFRFLNTWETPMSEAFGGHYQFLTIIGLTLALCTFVVGLLADATLSPRLFFVKNLLSICSTPLEVLISILYWGLSAIDKGLLMPPEHQLDFLPDFGFHAAPGLFLTLDLLLLSPPWTIHGYSAITLSQVLAFLYWFWVEYCFSHNGW